MEWELRDLVRWIARGESIREALHSWPAHLPSRFEYDMPLADYITATGLHMTPQQPDQNAPPPVVTVNLVALSLKFDRTCRTL